MPKNQPAMPQATLLRRSGKTIQPWGASEPVLACISISDDSIMVKLLLISCPSIVVCLPAILYQTSNILRICRRKLLAAASIHRQTAAIAGEQGWKPPSYERMRQIIKHLDPALVTPAHQGPAAYREEFDLL